MGLGAAMGKGEAAVLVGWRAGGSSAMFEGVRKLVMLTTWACSSRLTCTRARQRGSGSKSMHPDPARAPSPFLHSHTPNLVPSPPALRSFSATACHRTPSGPTWRQ